MIIKRRFLTRVVFLYKSIIAVSYPPQDINRGTTLRSEDNRLQRSLYTILVICVIIVFNIH